MVPPPGTMGKNVNPKNYNVIFNDPLYFLKLLKLGEYFGSGFRHIIKQNNLVDECSNFLAVHYYCVPKLVCRLQTKHVF